MSRMQMFPVRRRVVGICPKGLIRSLPPIAERGGRVVAAGSSQVFAVTVLLYSLSDPTQVSDGDRGG